jgi:hypothetical protein
MMSDSRFTATKLDTNKPPMDLVPWEAMTGVAQVLDFGRQKYAPHNWRKGFLWCRLTSAALRHVFAWLSGEDLDPESGLSHIDHALCCLMFLSAHIKSQLGKDDRACKLLTEGRADVPEQLPAAHVPKDKAPYYRVMFCRPSGKKWPAAHAGLGDIPFVSREKAQAAIHANVPESAVHRYHIVQVDE